MPEGEEGTTTPASGVTGLFNDQYNYVFAVLASIFSVTQIFWRNMFGRRNN